MYGIQKDGTCESVCRAAIEMQMQGTDIWTQSEKERAGDNWESKIDFGNFIWTLRFRSYGQSGQKFVMAIS